MPKATIIPMIGDSTMYSKTTSRPASFTTLVPAAAMPEPTYPPISACDEDEGRPSYQVIKSQVIPPTRAANTSSSIRFPTNRGDEIMLPPINFATGAPITKKAMKLNVAATRTASLGERTLVETTVEIEFAVS